MCDNNMCLHSSEQEWKKLGPLVQANPVQCIINGSAGSSDPRRPSTFFGQEHKTGRSSKRSDLLAGRVISIPHRQGQRKQKNKQKNEHRAECKIHGAKNRKLVAAELLNAWHVGKADRVDEANR